MSAIRLLLSHHGSRVVAQLAIACIAALSCAAHSAGMTVLVADDVAAHAEFVHELRETQEPGSRFDLRRLAEGAQVQEAAPGSDDRVAAGVRTRSIRSLSLIHI